MKNSKRILVEDSTGSSRESFINYDVSDLNVNNGNPLSEDVRGKKLQGVESSFFFFYMMIIVTDNFK